MKGVRRFQRQLGSGIGDEGSIKAFPNSLFYVDQVKDLVMQGI